MAIYNFLDNQNPGGEESTLFLRNKSDHKSKQIIEKYLKNFITKRCETIEINQLKRGNYWLLLFQRTRMTMNDISTSGGLSKLS